jgi:hypothetical protein
VSLRAPATPASRLLSLTKYRAQKRAIPFDLSIEDIVVPDFCPVLGLPLYRNTGGRAQGPNSPSVDRIDPAKGYVKGNVRVISSRANAIKSNATPEELLRVAAYFQEHR